MNNFLLPPVMLIIRFPFDSGKVINPPLDSSLANITSPYCGMY